jgi:AraC-like DNA-binding protein
LEATPNAPRDVDATLKRALCLMHGALHLRWTVAQLGRRVGMSRPVFAQRFRAALGVSPLRYLHALRMERAAALLCEPALGLAEVAERVGYSSEFAFNRAFKRHHRIAPGGFRKALRSRLVPTLRAA